jgi:hypothetical protein
MHYPCTRLEKDQRSLSAKPPLAPWRPFAICQLGYALKGAKVLTTIKWVNARETVLYDIALSDWGDAAYLGAE